MLSTLEILPISAITGDHEVLIGGWRRIRVYNEDRFVYDQIGHRRFYLWTKNNVPSSRDVLLGGPDSQWLCRLYKPRYEIKYEESIEKSFDKNNAITPSTSIFTIIDNETNSICGVFVDKVYAEQFTETLNEANEDGD